MLNVAAPVFQPMGLRAQSSNYLQSAIQSRIQGSSAPFDLSESQSSNHTGDIHTLPTASMYSSHAGEFSANISRHVHDLKPHLCALIPQYGYPELSLLHQPSQRYNHLQNQQNGQLTSLPKIIGAPFAANNQNIPHMGGPVPSAPKDGFFSSQYGLVDDQKDFMTNCFQRSLKDIRRVRPLKISGHNSTPSVSLNPASFAACIATARARPKIVVCIPNEGLTPEDRDLIEKVHDLHDDRMADIPDCLEQLHLALVRQKWTRRQPCAIQFEFSAFEGLPSSSIITREIYPKSLATLGLPDTIEIYLPGMHAWNACAESLLQETNSPTLVLPHQVKPSLLDPLAAPFQSHKKSQSISSTNYSLPTSVFELCHENIISESSTSQPKPLATEAAPASQLCVTKFRSEIPARLREAFAQRQTKGSKIITGHGYTMSLTLPSSGGPFAPEVFNALSSFCSTTNDDAATFSDQVPQVPGVLSERDRRSGKLVSLFTGNLESTAEEDVDEAHNGVTPRSWKSLRQGFGYSSETCKSPNPDAVMRTARVSWSAETVSDSDGQPADRSKAEDAKRSKEDDEEICTNPSEDADASDFDEDFDHLILQNWRFYRGSKLCGFRKGLAQEYEDASERSDEEFEHDSDSRPDEVYSNSSDEEAYREQQVLRRQHLPYQRAVGKLTSQGRPRADMNNTLPSSSIEVANDYELSGRFMDASLTCPSRVSDISNPSDELEFGSDTDDTAERNSHCPRADTSLLYQEYHFPPLLQPPRNSDILGSHASGSYRLSPSAKQADLRAAEGEVSAPIDQLQVKSALSYSHVPSMTDHTFSSRSLKIPVDIAPHLNVAAPAFTPAAFTFTAPKGVRLTLPDIAKPDPPFRDQSCYKDIQALSWDQCETQGREKRSRQEVVRTNEVKSDHQREGSQLKPGHSRIKRTKTSSQPIKLQSKDEATSIESSDQRNGLGRKDLSGSVNHGNLRPTAHGYTSLLWHQIFAMQEKAKESGVDVGVTTKAISDLHEINGQLASQLEQVLADRDSQRERLAAAQLEAARNKERAILAESRLQDEVYRSSQLEKQFGIMYQESVPGQVDSAKTEAIPPEFICAHQAEEGRWSSLQSVNERLVAELSAIRLQVSIDAKEMKLALAEVMTRAERGGQAVQKSVKSATEQPKQALPLEHASASDHFQEFPQTDGSHSLVSTFSMNDLQIDEAGWWS